MKSKDNQSFPFKLVYAITTHPVLGYRIEAFAVELNSDGSFSLSNHRISHQSINNTHYSWTDTDLKIIRITDEYSEQAIVRKYGKKSKKFDEFLKKECDDIRLEKVILPAINRRTNAIFQMIMDENLSLYYKGKKQDYIHDRKLNLLKGIVEVLFNVEKNHNGLKYYLSIRDDQKNLHLFKEKPVFLCVEPVRLLIDSTIYSFDKEFDRKKLQPFLTNEFISVPKNIEDKFFQTFLLKTLSKYDVVASGFKVEKSTSAFKPKLRLISDWQFGVSLLLEFEYPEKKFLPADHESCSVKLIRENNEVVFIKKQRDKAKENEIIELLLTNGLKKTGSGAFIPQETELNDLVFEDENLHYVLNWLNSHSALIKKLDIQLSQEYKGIKYFTGEIGIEFRVKEKIDWFDIFALVSFGGYQIPFVKLRKHIVFGKREYYLPDGTVAFLPEQWFNEYQETMLYAKEKDDTLVIDKKLYKLIKSFHGKNKTGYPQKKDGISTLSGFRKKSQPELFNGKLRIYQEIGYSWLYYIGNAGFGCCLADDLGLGKTIQSLAILQKDIEERKESAVNDIKSSQGVQLDLFSPPLDPEDQVVSLIVMPTSLIHNWVNEINKFTPRLRCYVHSGLKRAKNNFSFGLYDVILTSYGLVRNDFELFRSFRFNYVILDESQVIKNPESKIFESVIRLEALHKIILTGTPIENSLFDLWSQFQFINPGLLGNLDYFKREFLIPIEKNGEEKRVEKLKDLIRPFILRRTKNEVEKELPALTETVRYCEMTDEHAILYENKKAEIRNYIFREIENGGSQKKMFIVLKALMELRLIANHPVLYEKTYPFDSGKFNDVTYHMENLIEGNHKVLVFSSFVKHLDLYSHYLEDHRIPFEILTGKTPENQRRGIIENFQKNDNKKVFLISIKAGGVGLNLTAADYVYILDPWWNPAVEMQAISRAHRIGQNKKVFAYKFITKDTIEEKIVLLQVRKKTLADEFINSNNPLRAMSDNDITELFR